MLELPSQKRNIQDLNSNLKKYAEWFENIVCLGQSAGKTSKVFV